MIRVPTMIIATIAAVSYTATALLTYEVLVEANDVRVLRSRADRIRGHATMAAWAAAWPVAGALIAAVVVDEAVRGVVRR